jgi:hypothetical protein
MNTAELSSLKPVVSSGRRVLIVDGNVDAASQLALLVELSYCLGSTNERVKDRRDCPA